MNSIYILIPVALVFSAIAIRLLFWAVDNNQYDDLDASAQSILFDDDVDQFTTKDKDQPQAVTGKLDD
jgi:cbb3-type cytochrome oxidase maturation protein